MESGIPRPLLSLTNSPSSAASHSSVLLGSSYMYFAPSAGLPLPTRRLHSYVPYTSVRWMGTRPRSRRRMDMGRTLRILPRMDVPAAPPMPGHPAPLDADSTLDLATSAFHDLHTLTQNALTAFRAHEPATLPAAQALHTLKTGRSPPRGYEPPLCLREKGGVSWARMKVCGTRAGRGDGAEARLQLARHRWAHYTRARAQAREGCDVLRWGLGKHHQRSGSLPRYIYSSCIFWYASILGFIAP
ncbi:hypothetical protein B0H14DRAFT_1392885 [Mycena olivaceomarginata]|nr:hypothetical protein B0H14DRAFT_1392885 [Mycena olivaceomarginata]